MADEIFRLPGSSYDEIVRIIRGYGHFTDVASNAQVGTAAAIHQTQVSRNNGFLSAIGVVEGGTRKVLTNGGRSLALALEHEIPDEIGQKWRQIVQTNDFLQKLLSAVRIRRGMDPGTLQAHIAYSAGQPKSPKVMTGAATVIDVLRAAELLREQDGKLIYVEGGEGPGVRGTPPTPLPPAAEIIPVTGSREVTVERPITVQTGRAGVGIQIQVRVACTVEELDTVATKLRDLIETLDAPKTSPADSGV